MAATAFTSKAEGVGSDLQEMTPKICSWLYRFFSKFLRRLYEKVVFQERSCLSRVHGDT